MERVKVSFDIETLPLYIKDHVKGSNMYDSSCSEVAKTYYVEGHLKAFLKIYEKDGLLREYKMTNFLSQHHLAPKAIAYESDLHHDYLLTEAIVGEEGISGGHLDNPKKLAEVFGENLRRLHLLNIDGCPYTNRTAEILDEISSKDHRSNDLHIIPEGTHQALENLDRLKSLAIDDVIIHGDYCLPNIILDQYKFKGFIDLGYGGVGDRHYDIFWGIWTLQYNFKTDRFKDTFLDAYGREDIDEERLELCRLLAGLTG